MKEGLVQPGNTTSPISAAVCASPVCPHLLLRLPPLPPLLCKADGRPHSLRPAPVALLYQRLQTLPTAHHSRALAWARGLRRGQGQHRVCGRHRAEGRRPRPEGRCGGARSCNRRRHWCCERAGVRRRVREPAVVGRWRRCGKRARLHRRICRSAAPPLRNDRRSGASNRMLAAPWLLTARPTGQQGQRRVGGRVQTI